MINPKLTHNTETWALRKRNKIAKKNLYSTIYNTGLQIAFTQAYEADLNMGTVKLELVKIWFCMGVKLGL
jgi:hypothetical protein